MCLCIIVRVCVRACVRVCVISRLSTPPLTNTARGEVFTWGLNDHGQCGQCPVPKPTPLPNKEVQSGTVECKATALVSEGGQDGGLAGKRHIWWPHILEGIEPAVRVHCGWSHVVMVTGTYMCNSASLQ